MILKNKLRDMKTGFMKVVSLCGRRALFASVIFAAWSAPVFADDTGKGNDPVFGGQILSLTDPGAIAIGVDSDRFTNNKDGTVIDFQEKKIWILRDSYQELKKWINWEEAQGYISDLNQKKFAGSDRWRLPTKEELATLYDKTKIVEWNYYWTRNKVHIDPIFGQSSCCYWSSQSYQEKFAWGFNYIRGKPYVSMKGGIQKSLTVIRAVRDSD